LGTSAADSGKVRLFTFAAEFRLRKLQNALFVISNSTKTIG
jgi:hypothetical protein